MYRSWTKIAIFHNEDGPQPCFATYTCTFSIKNIFRTCSPSWGSKLLSTWLSQTEVHLDVSSLRSFFFPWFATLASASIPILSAWYSSSWSPRFKCSSSATSVAHNCCYKVCKSLHLSLQHQCFAWTKKLLRLEHLVWRNKSLPGSSRCLVRLSRDTLALQ